MRMKKTQTILVDTNVWLDFYAIERPHSAASKQLLSYAFAHDIGILYPADIIKDVFYLVTSTTKQFLRAKHGTLTHDDAALANEFAWSAVNHMRENAFAVSIGQADVWYAAKMRPVHGDFEDNLVLAAADQAKATFLVTNDQQLIAHAPVAALTPGDALKALQARFE